MTAEQLKSARGLLRWGQQELADASGVLVLTIKRLETGDGDLKGHTVTLRATQAGLEATGVQFIPENGGGAGVRLAKPKGAE